MYHFVNDFKQWELTWKKQNGTEIERSRCIALTVAWDVPILLHWKFMSESINKKNPSSVQIVKKLLRRVAT